MSDVIPAIILEKRKLARSVTRFVFGHAAGLPLPSFTPGSHIRVFTPGGHTRSYSLTDSPGNGFSYAIAVEHQPDGRGGSHSLIADSAPGDMVQISLPANAFELVEADDYLLIAGGIGITPIRAMYKAISENPKARVCFIYLTRNIDGAAFAGEVQSISRSIIHESSSDGRLDLWPFLKDPGRTHLYCCGSSALMEQVRMLTMHWNPRHVHFEDFNRAASSAVELPFTVTWAPTGQHITVSRTETILDALSEAGIRRPSSCLSGTCGTCILRVNEGTADHRDTWLNDSMRNDYILPCVSRAMTDSIGLAPVHLESDGLA